MSAGKGSFIDEIISLAGGVNISSKFPKPYGLINPEYVIKEDPQIIILAYTTKEEPNATIGSRTGWNNIRAVKSKRIFKDISPDILLRPGPRLIDGLKEINKRLYP